MKRETRTVLLVVAALGVAGCVVAGGAMALFMSVIDGFAGDQSWSADALPERELPTVFGVRLPVKPLRYTSRQLGFQDAFFEVLVELPPGSAETFLGVNHLSRGASAPVSAELKALLEAQAPGLPTFTSTSLELPETVFPDGGQWLLHRSGELLEGPGGEVWLYLQAFET